MKINPVLKGIDKYWMFIVVTPLIVLYTVFFIYPLIQGILISFTSWDGVTTDKTFIGLENYYTMFSDKRVLSSFSFTFILTAAMIIGQLVIGLGLALLLSTKMRLQGFFRTMYFIPALLCGMTVSLIFMKIFQYGIPQIGETLNIEWLKYNPLGSHWGAVLSIIFVMLWKGVAIPTLLFLGGLSSVPDDILEAATIDGANAVQTFFSVKIPFLLTTITMVFIMAMKTGLLAYDVIVTLTYGTVDTESVGLLIYNYGIKSYRFGYSNAIAIVMFLVIIIFSAIQIRVTSKYGVDNDGR